MTRIVAGAARGRRLVVPPRGTRPTTDRVRESVFNVLAARLDSITLADLAADFARRMADHPKRIC